MIAFRGVGKTYRSIFGKSVRAVDDVTLEAHAGEVLGIAGPNGAGKSTLISLLLGYLAPTDGDVTIDGVAPRAFIEREGIGYLSELVNIPPLWKAREALARYAILAGIPAADCAARVERVITLLGLDEHRDKRVKALSKGNLQRLGLAQALLREERVLILDEPTHGLDPVWTQKFRDIVDALRRPDRVMLIASHNLDELQRLADRVAIIDHGQVQRVVHVRAAAAGTAHVTYRLTLERGAEAAQRHLPGATVLADGTIEVAAGDLVALNAGIAAAIADGAVFRAIGPAHSALEQQFREAVGADA